MSRFLVALDGEFSICFWFILSLYSPLTILIESVGERNSLTPEDAIAH